MIAVIDYGAGNLFSVKNALDFLGQESVFTRDPAVLEQADGLILPGVGAFPDAMRMLEEAGLPSVIREQAGKKPFLGVCLGMQLLFDAGLEFGETPGLGLIPGRVVRIPTSLKIPHMGYNQLEWGVPSPLLEGLDEGSWVYFVHSYMAETAPAYVAAFCDYGARVPALVQRGQIFGAQFHPEKSGDTGLRILRNFCGLLEQSGKEGVKL